MKNTTKTPQQVINDKSSKWTIKPATNKQVFDPLTICFTPREQMTGLSATEWNAALALPGEKVNAVKPLNAIRAAFLAAKFALDYGGRVSSRVSNIIASNGEIIDAVDAASAEYTDARNAYNRAKKNAERDALLLSVSTDDNLRRRAQNSAEALAHLKEEMEAARRILADATAAESKANAAVLEEYAKMRQNANANANANATPEAPEAPEQKTASDASDASK